MLVRPLAFGSRPPPPSPLPPFSSLLLLPPLRFLHLLSALQLVFTVQIFPWLRRLISISQAVLTDASTQTRRNSSSSNATGAPLPAVKLLKDLLSKRQRRNLILNCAVIFMFPRYERKMCAEENKSVIGVLSFLSWDLGQMLRPFNETFL